MTSFNYVTPPPGFLPTTDIPVPVDLGGTGQSAYADGQLLIGNAAGGLTKATLTAGANVTISNGDGSIQISASGGGGGGAYSLFQELTVGGGGSATIDFTSIPQTARHIEIFYSLTEGSIPPPSNCTIRFNEDSGSNYTISFVEMYNNGSSGAFNLASSNGNNGMNLAYLAGSSGNSPGSGKFMVPYYSSTSLIKGLIGQGLGQSTYGPVITNFAGGWNSSAAITEITIISSSSSGFNAGSKASLYLVA